MHDDNIYLTGEYFRKNPTYDVGDSHWKARQILKMLDRHHLRPGSVCEVGCGAGEVLRRLQENLPSGTALCGYEISPDAYALCRGRENAGLRFFRADLLKEDAGDFDLLLCIDVFEHVENYMGFLRELRSKAVLKLFHIPLDMWVFSVLFATPITRARRRYGHLHYFSKDTALATLEDTGYQIVDWFYTPAANDRGSGLTATLGKWPRRLVWAVYPDLAVRLLGGYSLLVLAR